MATLTADPLALAALLLAVLAAARLLEWLGRVADAGAGYKAKVLASAVFVSRREAAAVLAEDVALDSYRILRLFRARVSRSSVTASFLGLRPRTATYREGRGATLGVIDSKIRKPPPAALSNFLINGTLLEGAFAEPDRLRLRRTRAVIVIRDGKVLAERYAPGFGPGTALCGWSMTKSVLGSLIGAAVGRGLLRPEDRGLLPAWNGPGDRRGAISLEDLLRMRSGLAFAEVYADPASDVTQMLFALPDTARFAASKSLEAPPGTLWRYSSGTSNIVSGVLRRALERAGGDYHAFPRKALFGPLGMDSAVFETDEAGTFVGSSFLYATARDWARFGQLHLQDGVWAGNRLLPEGWVRFMTTPTAESPGGCYGAHWWLKVAREMGGDSPEARLVPVDAYHAFGHEGQCLTVIPSRGLVVVRLGLSIYIDAWNHAAFLAGLLRQLG